LNWVLVLSTVLTVLLHLLETLGSFRFVIYTMYMSGRVVSDISTRAEGFYWINYIWWEIELKVYVNKPDFVSCRYTNSLYSRSCFILCFLHELLIGEFGNTYGNWTSKQIPPTRPRAPRTRSPESRKPCIFLCSSPSGFPHWEKCVRPEGIWHLVWN
jgi:hypothetical protein